jgi:uridine kinase
MNSSDLKYFLDDKGRATAWPAKKQKQEALLDYLAKKFEGERSYSEAEVNEILKLWHTFEDWALLRRELFNKGYLDRDTDGSNYRLSAQNENQSNKILHAILSIKKPDERPLIIAISGFGGSGKSTLAADLKAKMEHAEIISLDAFGIDQLSGRSNDWANFDRKRLQEQVLEPAKSGEDVRYEEYDFKTNTIVGWQSVPASVYLIVEGCSCIHPDLLSYYDFTIWVDCPLDQATERGIARDLKWGYDSKDLWHSTWMPNEKDFYDKFRPDQQADFLYKAL